MKRAPTWAWLAGLLLMMFLPAAASAGDRSSFRLMEIKPIKGGARVTLSYDNEWGSPETNEANKTVTLYAHPAKPASEVTDRVIGTFDMLGKSTLDVDLDYAALRLKEGQNLHIHGRWKKSNHGWGAGLWSRDSGCLSLPAAKNAGFRRVCGLRLQRWLRSVAPGSRSLRPHPRLPRFARPALRPRLR